MCFNSPMWSRNSCKISSSDIYEIYICFSVYKYSYSYSILFSFVQLLVVIYCPDSGMTLKVFTATAAAGSWIVFILSNVLTCKEGKAGDVHPGGEGGGAGSHLCCGSHAVQVAWSWPVSVEVWRIKLQPTLASWSFSPHLHTNCVPLLEDFMTLQWCDCIGVFMGSIWSSNHDIKMVNQAKCDSLDFPVASGGSWWHHHSTQYFLRFHIFITDFTVEGDTSCKEVKLENLTGTTGPVEPDQ